MSNLKLNQANSNCNYLSLMPLLLVPIFVLYVTLLVVSYKLFMLQCSLVTFFAMWFSKIPYLIEKGVDIVESFVCPFVCIRYSQYPKVNATIPTKSTNIIRLKNNVKWDQFQMKNKINNFPFEISDIQRRVSTTLKKYFFSYLNKEV